MKRVVLMLACALTLAGSATAVPKKAPAAAPAAAGVISQNPYLGAIVVDAITGKVLFEANADAKGYPASVLKLMDLLVILEKVEQKQLSFTNQVPVSAKSSKTGGSQVWLAQGESFTVDEMLYALMIQSANDAAVALAEKVAGSTEQFVVLMNKRAAELGMKNTLFHSVHGLPPGHNDPQIYDVTTARDLSLLCRELLRHADTLRYTSTRQRVFRPEAGPKAINMTNHDHLLGQVEGCDGFKTGYITKAGYSIALTAARNGQRVIAIVLDSSDRKGRDARAAELIAKGFATASTAPPPAPVAPAAPVVVPASQLAK